MSDSEYEEEEYLVYADFKNQVLHDKISDPKASIKVIGIESKNPIIEINGNIFKGNYDFAVGTKVFFEKDMNAIPADPLYETSCHQKYKYYGKTNKVINFQRIYVENKAKDPEVVEENSSGYGDNQEETTEEESLKLNITYEEAIKLFPVATEEK